MAECPIICMRAAVCEYIFLASGCGPERSAYGAALQDAKRLMPQMDIAQTLRSNPELVLSFQKGKNLIPYDPAWPVQPQK